MSATPQNQVPNHPEPTRNVTVSISEWCFLLICLTQASSRQPRGKVMARIVQQIMETPDQPLKLGFAKQDYRSLTAALPIELYKVVYEQASRHAESDSQYISRMLEQALPAEIHDLISKLILELRKWSIAPEPQSGQHHPTTKEQPGTELTRSLDHESSLDADDLTKFLADHSQTDVRQAHDNSAIENSASDHDQSPSIEDN